MNVTFLPHEWTYCQYVAYCGDIVGRYEHNPHYGKRADGTPRGRFTFENDKDISLMAFDIREETFKQYLEDFCTLYVNCFHMINGADPMFKLIVDNQLPCEILTIPVPFNCFYTPRDIMFISDRSTARLVTGMQRWVA